LLEGSGKALHQLVAFLGVDQPLNLGAPQWLGPISQPRPGGGRGVENLAAGSVTGDQVGGVLDDQAIQPAGDQCQFMGLQGVGSVPRTALYMLAIECEKTPQQLPLVG